MKVENKELQDFTEFLTRLSNEKLMKLAILMQLKYCRSLLLSKTIVTYRTADRAILQQEMCHMRKVRSCDNASNPERRS